MERKADKVTMTANGITQEFEVSHAERILRMPRNGGWKLQDTNYQFINNGIIRTNKRGNKKPFTQGFTGEGSETSEQTEVS
jgi:hypothetical protein